MRNRMGSSLNLDTTVVGLQGFPISSTPPASGQALVFDGTDWVPSDVAAGGHFVPQLDPTNDVAVSSLGGPGGGPLISAFENPVSPDADFLAIRTQRDVDGTAIFLRGPTFPDPNSANGLQMWLGDGGNLLFNFTNTGQLNLPAMPVNPMDATPRQYVDTALASLPPPAVVGSTPPSNPVNGQLWWDTVSGQLFIWYVDANSSQWVVANVSVGVPGPPGAPGPNVMPPGVTDGSQAAPGQVGEILKVTVPVSSTLIVNGTNETPGFSTAQSILGSALLLTNGDWEVYYDFSVTAAFSQAAAVTAYATMQSGSFGDVPSFTRTLPGYQYPASIGNGYGGIGVSGNYTIPQVNITDASASKYVWAQYNTTVIGSQPGSGVTVSGNAFFWARRMR